MQIDKLIEELYQKPAVKDLEKITDRNKNHTEADVLIHTKGVESGLLATLGFEFVSEPVKSRLRQYFDEKIGDYTRAELLQAAAVLHDIGKAMRFTDKKGVEQAVMVIKENGDTTCPEHAKVGAEAAYQLLKEMNLNEPEAKYVKKVIEAHMRLFNLYDSGNQNIAKVAKDLGEVYLDVLLQTRADCLGSNKREGDYKAEVAAFSNLIEESMKVREAKGKVDGLETLDGTVYLTALESEVKEGLKTLYAEQIKAKVEAGQVAAEKVLGIVEKKVNGLMQKLKFGPAPEDYKTILKERPIVYTLEK